MAMFGGGRLPHDHDGDRATIQVDVVPVRAEYLVAAHAGDRGQPQGGEQPMTCGAPQERLQLVRRPLLVFDLGMRAQPRGVGDEGDVSRTRASANGVAESAADDEVYFQHALGGQHPSAVVGMEQPFVERLEGGGAEAADGDAPQGRHDVTVDLAAVAVPGTRAQCQPLAGQPDGGEAGAEAQRTHRVVAASLRVAGELRLRPGLCPPGANCDAPGP